MQKAQCWPRLVGINQSLTDKLSQTKSNKTSQQSWKAAIALLLHRQNKISHLSLFYNNFSHLLSLAWCKLLHSLPAETAENTETTETAETAETAETGRTAETAETADTAETVETAETTEATELLNC